MACKDDPYENSNPLQGLTFDCTTGETRIYIHEGELKMDASQTEIMKILGPRLVMCQLHELKMA